MKIPAFIFALAAGMAGIVPAQADATTGGSRGIVSELRAGIMAHDAYPNWIPREPGSFRFDQIEDIGFDVLFRSPDVAVFRWIGSPRPNFGGTMNFDGQESMYHLGLTWQVHLGDSPVYLEGTAGGAIHDGNLGGDVGRTRPMGCRFSFYSGVGVGADLTDRVTATLTYEHVSNAELCDENYGLSNVGLKLGVTF